jgi:aspartyl-tRNA(Asn)/glutamyl-tRNA(Gln) amidotransferase subunit A
VAIDRRVAAGQDPGPLAGVPVGVKDIICTAGLRTTAASRMLEGFVPAYDATVTARLRQAGAVIVGKLNCDEFAMGSSTENSALGTTRNPWDLARVPGGSSGGSAVAVAARECHASLGTDTGGSVRLPAAFSGVVGLKPTYGRVSRYGVIAYASSLDQVGPLARDVADVAVVLEAIAGHDPADSTASPRPVPSYLTALDGTVRGLRLGLPREYFVEGMQPEVQAGVRAAVDELERLGARIEPVSLPHTEYAIATYYLIATAEASSNLARYDGVRYGLREPRPVLGEMYEATRAAGFGAEVKRRIMLGTYALSAGYYDAYYLKAQRVRTLIRMDFQKALESCDALVTPVAPTTAFRLGEKTADPLTMYLSDIFTISVNLAGLPALALPCGFDRAGLPIGLQVIGRPFEESTVLRVGHAYEQATEWHRRRPPT